MFEDPHLTPTEFARRVNDRLPHIKDHLDLKNAKWFLEHGWTPTMLLREFHALEETKDNPWFTPAGEKRGLLE